jgi:hypothetical protein
VALLRIRRRADAEGAGERTESVEVHIMLPPVVAAVDGSAESLAAAEWAAHEAVRRERPLQLLHAWNWHPRQGEGDIANAAQRQLARRVLRQAELRALATCPDVRLHDAQAEGPATAALLKAAEQPTYWYWAPAA